ncbi:MAG: hypothetical protein VKP70_05495 [Cyanobacteriota bacterium]|nr:hypothetical protein [Cyanobacteriota bacterium]
MQTASGCFDCGATWSASDVQELLGVVWDCSGVSLDFALKQDRDYASRLLAHLQAHRKKVVPTETTAMETNATAGQGSANPAAPWPLRAALRLAASALVWWIFRTVLKTMDPLGGLLPAVVFLLLPTLRRHIAQWRSTIPVRPSEAELLRLAALLREQARTNLVSAIQAFAAAHPPPGAPAATPPSRHPPPPPPPLAKSP